GAHSERACHEMPLALGPLMGDRVLALSLAAPGERAPVALAFLQAGAALHGHCLDALGAIDLADAIEIGSIQPALRDLGYHLVLEHDEPPCSPGHGRAHGATARI